MAEGIARGEVRLYRFRHPDKERPVVVLTREFSIRRLSTVAVAAITSTVRSVPSEVVLTEDDGMKKVCAVNLHHVTTVARDRLGRRVTQLSGERMREVCAALNFALGCDG